MSKETSKSKVEGGASQAPWPFLMPGAFATEDFRRIQHQMVTSAARIGQDAIKRLDTEFEQGTSIVQRMISAKSPEDLFACQRDMLELIGAKYVEAMTKCAENASAFFAGEGQTRG